MRRSLPFVMLAGFGLLVGATLAMAASGIRPTPEILAWLGGQAGESSAALASAVGPSDSGAGRSVAPTASSASLPASGGASPAPAPASPAATRNPATPAPSGAPGAVSARPGRATGGQAHAVYNGSRARKVVALTFDDGYNPVALRRILAILKRDNVVATFFPYGWAVHNDPAGWQMVVAAGYPIGNHTQSHAILTTLTPDEVTSEMVRGQRTIDLYSGGTSINLMRPPGGAFNAPTAKAIAKAGYYTIVMWDVDTFDWQGPSAATIVARAIRGTNGSIVLMHAGPMNTPRALPAIIANYRARGFTFVTVPELLAGS